MVAPLRLTYLLSISVRKNILWATIHLSSVHSPSQDSKAAPRLLSTFLTHCLLLFLFPEEQKLITHPIINTTYGHLNFTNVMLFS